VDQESSDPFSILGISGNGSKKENGAWDAEDLSAAASHVQPRRFLQDPMLHVAGDHEEFSLIKIVDESAAAAAWLSLRVVLVFSCQDDWAAAFNAAPHGSLPELPDEAPYRCLESLFTAAEDPRRDEKIKFFKKPSGQPYLYLHDGS